MELLADPTAQGTAEIPAEELGDAIRLPPQPPRGGPLALARRHGRIS